MTSVRGLADHVFEYDHDRLTAGWPIACPTPPDSNASAP